MGCVVDNVATRLSDALRITVLNGDIVEVDEGGLNGGRLRSSRVEVPVPLDGESLRLLLLLVEDKFWQVRR